MRQIRAKFRCLSITEKWNDGFIAELAPVMQKGENSEENKRFWKYTPAGTATLVFHKEHSLKIGAYYYIDMTADEKGDWFLSSVTKDGSSAQGRTGGKVTLAHYRQIDWRDIPTGLIRGSLEVQLSGEANGTLDFFGDAGGRWTVEFNVSVAEPSDNEAG